LSPFLQNKADLIVALTDSALARAPDRPNTTMTDAELFGTQISNPYPDQEDEASLLKYRRTRIELERVIDNTFDRLLDLAKARPAI
jgi:hypothetical protein